MVGWGWQSRITPKLTSEEDFIQDYFSKGERLNLSETNGWRDFRHWSGLMRKCWRNFFWGGVWWSVISVFTNVFLWAICVSSLTIHWSKTSSLPQGVRDESIISFYLYISKIRFLGPWERCVLSYKVGRKLGDLHTFGRVEKNGHRLLRSSSISSWRRKNIENET